MTFHSEVLFKDKEVYEIFFCTKSNEWDSRFYAERLTGFKANVTFYHSYNPITFAIATLFLPVMSYKDFVKNPCKKCVITA